MIDCVLSKFFSPKVQKHQMKRKALKRKSNISWSNVYSAKILRHFSRLETDYLFKQGSKYEEYSTEYIKGDYYSFNASNIQFVHMFLKFFGSHHLLIPKA